MSRRAVGRWMLCLLALPASTAAFAQSQDGATGSPPETIDLTAPPPEKSTAASDEACKRRREAALISGEIVVCGGSSNGEQPTLGDKEARQNRYARETMNKGTLPTPDVAGPGIFRGPATFGGVCVKGIFNCPKPPALLIDVSRLPQAPPGSDADRIARGLDPLGDDNRAVTSASPTPGQRAELGLPDPPEPAVSPAKSAEPAAPQ